MVQKVTQQIRRGEQAIYRQELDEKSRLTATFFLDLR